MAKHEKERKHAGCSRGEVSHELLIEGVKSALNPASTFQTLVKLHPDKI